VQLELGVLARSSGARSDVLVQVAAGTPLDAVRSEILSLVAPGQASGELSVGGRGLSGRAPLGRPPLVRGALLEVGSRPGAATATVALHCVGGPDAGSRWALGTGEAVLGRDASAAVRVDDPLVSRVHCTLHVDAGRGTISVTDRGTTNGTSVDGSHVTAPRSALLPGAVLTVGASRFSLATDDHDDAPTRPDGAGSIAFNRPPRRRTAPAQHPIDFPAAPSASERRPLPVLAVLAPLVLGVVLWRVLGSATFLLFTLLSPVMVIGSAVTDHRSGRRRDRRALERHRREIAHAAERLRTAVEEDVRRRRARWPDPATTTRTALRPGERLWERRRSDDDVLTVCVGTADQPAAVPVTGEPPPGATTAPGVPVVVPLAAAGVLGVCGPGELARAVARWISVQAAVWHSPRDLSIVVLASGATAPEWEWARWLPHVRPTDGQPCRVLLGVGTEQAAARVAELRAAAAQRRSGPRSNSVPRRVLLVVDGGPALHGITGLAELLGEGPDAGVHAVVVAEDRRLLPETCGALVAVDEAGGAQVEIVHDHEALTGAVADGMSVRTAEQVARALAPLRDTTAEPGAAGLARTVSWCDLVGLDLTGGPADGEAVAQRWAAGGGTRALLGSAADGPLAVDLCTDGPHALVAGTTGSGKSELLQTWIASLALANPPDALNLLLVDYKGGAAFGPCAGLPHVVGTVTDLDGARAARALASLGAELRRREGLLAACGARDVDEHRRRSGPHAPMPRLVLMVDEFASLAEELPDFVDGLVGIAMRGRSLGVHLVLATQRPGGVVSADIRANTNLRVCLAVARDADSRDVLDSPVAAHLSRTTPGRGFVRTGHTELTAVQVARVSAPRRARAAAPPVTLLPVAEAGDPVPAAAGDKEADSELALLVDACVAAAASAGLPAPVPPWTPPLPESLELDALPAYDEPLAGGGGRLPPLAYGLLDLPEQQRQLPLAFDLDRSTHLLAVGAPRSGRTTVLRTFAGALARAVPADDAHLYVVDATGQGLAGLADLPHTGAVVSRGETDRLTRVLGWLGEEVTRRQQLLAAGGFGSLAEQRASAGPAHRLPGLVLLLDGYDAFLADHADRDAGRLVDLVLALLRDGPAAGLHVILTAGRGALTGRLTALVDTRLVLRLADRGDYALAGVPDRLVGAAPVAGRGWLIDGDGCAAVQVARLGQDASGTVPQRGPDGAPDGVCGSPARLHPPHRVLPLPESVARAELTAPRPLRRGEIVLGAGGDDGSAVVADVTGGFLVAGPPGSGRSTALMTIALQLRAAGMPIVAVGPRASPLRDLAGCLTDGDDVGGLQALLDRGACAVLVDDAELVVTSPVAAVLERTVRSARDTGHLVVAAGTTDDLVLGYRGFVVDLRRSRRGVLLWPQQPADGDLLDVRVARTATAPGVPGRGLLCLRGAVQPVQVAR
jgi:S-DNA-T family DNA segregation ATPase FtsK/SpoIIIE